MDGRKNNRGTKGNKGGRPPKADEIKKIETMDSIAAPAEVWGLLWSLCQEGNVQALKIWIEHREGKPRQTTSVSIDQQEEQPIFYIDLSGI